MLSIITFIFTPLSKNFYFMCMNVLFAHYVFLLHVCLVRVEVRRGHRSPGTRVMEGCEPHAGGFWESNLCPLQEQACLAAGSFSNPFTPLLKNRFILFLLMYVCLCVCMYVHTCQLPSED